MQKNEIYFHPMSQNEDRILKLKEFGAKSRKEWKICLKYLDYRVLKTVKKVVQMISLKPFDTSTYVKQLSV